MAKEELHHLDFVTLILVNKEVVALTQERHEYEEEEDGKRLRSLVEEVSRSFNQDERETALSKKASLLMFKIATGQHFHEGNKRTALVAGSAFLKMNGCAIDIKDDGLVSAIDRAGVARATLSELEDVMKGLVKCE